MILGKIKQLIYRPYAIAKIWYKFRPYKCSSTDNPRLYLLNIPSHGNLGDHLLSVAEHEFLKDNFPHLQIVPVTSSDLYYSIKVSLSSVRQNDILCITGGGFLGSLYDEEERFLAILKMFPQNKVIVLPQTIYYEDNIKGYKALERAKAFYESHNKLYVVARDQNTYDLLIKVLMKDHEDRVAFTPDLALYINKPADFERDGILWCLRKDAEISVSNTSLVKELTKQVKTLGFHEVFTDTYVSYPISYELEEEEVQKKIEEFSHVKLVITDRLHGMIYSVITGTPVIAMDNISGKVGQVYDQWIKDLNYVRFISNTDDLKDIVYQMLSIHECTYNNRHLVKMYQPIIDFINA